MFPYICDGNQKLFSLIFDYFTNILLKHSNSFSAQHLLTITFTKEMAGFPNKEKYFTPCLTSIFENCIGAQICVVRPLWLGKADSWQFRIWSQPTQLLCAAKYVPGFLITIWRTLQPLKLSKVAIPSVKDLWPIIFQEQASQKQNV